MTGGNHHQHMEVKMGVQITLFKALKEAKVSGENAEKVVSELEE